jgi:hypothetical protein
MRLWQALACTIVPHAASALPTPHDATHADAPDETHLDLQRRDASYDADTYDPFPAHELNGLRSSKFGGPWDDTYSYDPYIEDHVLARRTRDFELRVDDLELVPSPSPAAERGWPWKAMPGPCPALAMEIGVAFELDLRALTTWSTHPDETRAFELAYHRLRDAVCADGGGAPSSMLEMTAL